MAKLTLEEWAKKYGPLTLKQVYEFKRSVRLIFEGRDSTLWEVAIGVYDDNFCIAGECHSLLIKDRVHRCINLKKSEPEPIEKIAEELRGKDILEVEEWIKKNCKNHAEMTVYESGDLRYKVWLGEKDGVTIVAYLSILGGREHVYLTTENMKSVIYNHFQGEREVTYYTPEGIHHERYADG